MNKIINGFAALCIHARFFTGEIVILCWIVLNVVGVAAAQDFDGGEPAESAIMYVDPAVPAKDNRPLFDVRKSQLTGNPEIRPFDPKRPRILSALKYTSRQGTGYADARYLLIEYPWTKIQGASIEIRILDEKVKSRPTWCVPVYFNEIYRKNQPINDLIFMKRLPDTQAAFGSKYFNEDYMKSELLPKSELTIWSFNTMLNRKGIVAYMQRNNENTQLRETTLIYPELSDWCATPHTLCLELLGEPFDEDCDIRVWLIKSNAILWEEDFVWPGNLSAGEIKAQRDKARLKEIAEKKAKEVEKAEN